MPALAANATAEISPPSAARRIAVIGGGISGLAAAHRLVELAPAARVTLLEASDRLGGVLQTIRRDGWLIERSADMFTTREPWALDLCRRIGIADELIETDVRFRRAFVVRRGKLLPVPEGFTLMSPAKIWPILTTPILSPLGKLRLAWERFIPCRRDDADESLQSFVVRRFGREAFDRLIQPLIGGIYTADPAKLSMQGTLPQFVELERKFGSLIRGMRQRGKNQVPGAASQKTAESGARYGQFLAPRDGMGRLVEGVAARLPVGCVRLNSPVERIERDREQWCLWLGNQAECFDAVVLATSGAVSYRLLAMVDAELAALVKQIPYAGCSVAILGVRRDQLRHPLDGFGFVVPAMENRRIIAGSLASVKFPGRAPTHRVLLRVFVGGALQPELAHLPDDEVRGLVLTELRELLGLAGMPEFFEVARWLGMMPQYHVGHLDLIRRIEARASAIPNFALAGNAYRGVGVPFCVNQGEQAAERILSRQVAPVET
ncbi:MAG: protoporphyrinogen oxidase [Pirellulaceae bacterium]|nr:protoporphyrinogen oxidase [Pirellulaceae bacterium]